MDLEINVINDLHIYRKVEMLYKLLFNFNFNYVVLHKLELYDLLREIFYISNLYKYYKWFYINRTIIIADIKQNNIYFNIKNNDAILIYKNLEGDNDDVKCHLNLDIVKSKSGYFNYYHIYINYLISGRFDSYTIKQIHNNMNNNLYNCCNQYKYVYTIYNMDQTIYLLKLLRLIIFSKRKYKNHAVLPCELYEYLYKEFMHYTITTTKF